MALLKLRRFFQFTLPAGVRKQFHLAEGDYLGAEAVEEGILLKPVHMVEWQKAWEGVGEVRGRVHATLPPHQNALRSRRRRSRRWSKTIEHDRAHVILNARGLVRAFVTTQGVRDERLRHGWRGVFVLCRCEKIL